MNKIDKIVNDELDSLKQDEVKINKEISSDKYSIENFNKYLQSVIEHLPKNGNEGVFNANANGKSHVSQMKNLIALKKFNTNQNYLKLNKKKKK